MSGKAAKVLITERQQVFLELMSRSRKVKKVSRAIITEKTALFDNSD